MRKLFIYLALSVSCLSCNLFPSDDELLTRDLWIIYVQGGSLDQEGNFSESRSYFTSDEQKFNILFNVGGSVIANIREEGGQQIGSWAWKDDNHGRIVIRLKGETTEYIVSGLDEDGLTLTYHQPNTTNMVTRMFHHADNPKMTDEVIKTMK